MSNFNVEKFVEEIDENKRWIENEKEKTSDNFHLTLHFSSILTSLNIVRNCVIRAYKS